MRFIHFKFGSHYGEYLDAPTEAIQRAVVDDPDKDTFVYMHCTKWFSLQSPRGRESALCHILALIRWHDKQNAFQPADSSASSEDDSDFDMEDDSH